MSWIYEKSGSRFQIRNVEGIRAVYLADVSDERLAVRVVVLLNRHGMEDVPLEDPDAETA